MNTKQHDVVGNSHVTRPATSSTQAPRMRQDPPDYAATAADDVEDDSEDVEEDEGDKEEEDYDEGEEEDEGDDDNDGDEEDAKPPAQCPSEHLAESLMPLPREVEAETHSSVATGSLPISRSDSSTGPALATVEGLPTLRSGEVIDAKNTMQSYSFVATGASSPYSPRGSSHATLSRATKQDPPEETIWAKDELASGQAALSPRETLHLEGPSDDGELAPEQVFAVAHLLRDSTVLDSHNVGATATMAAWLPSTPSPQSLPPVVINGTSSQARTITSELTTDQTAAVSDETDVPTTSDMTHSQLVSQSDTLSRKIRRLVWLLSGLVVALVVVIVVVTTRPDRDTSTAQSETKANNPMETLESRVPTPTPSIRLDTRRPTAQPSEITASPVRTNAPQSPKPSSPVRTNAPQSPKPTLRPTVRSTERPTPSPRRSPVRTPTRPSPTSLNDDRASSTPSSLSNGNRASTTPSSMPADGTSRHFRRERRLLPAGRRRNRKDMIVSYVNSITLTGRTLSLQRTDLGLSPEEQALQWLIHQDPWQHLLPITRYGKFRIQQRYALLSLWFQHRPDTRVDWAMTDGWASTPNECQWFGIVCQLRYFEGMGWQTAVTEIRLANNGMTQHFIPPDLGLLVKLTHVSFHGNELVGTLPDSIGFWTNLEFFDVGINGLTGTLPESVGQWTNLQVANLHNNLMTGVLPLSLVQWTNIKGFAVYNNQFVGSIPMFIGKVWTRIEYIGLHNNKLSGAISNETCTVPSLVFLEADCMTKVTCPCCTDCY